MKLSVVIISWNDGNCILECLRSVFAETRSLEFEVIVTDNGSTDGSLVAIRREFPQVRLVENGVNLGYGPGNNAGIEVAKGEYILLLNPDTIVRERALEKLVAHAERSPEAGAWGCRVLNPDGSWQQAAQPMPTILGYLIGALCWRWLGFLSARFLADRYLGWDGRSERTIGFQAGCCLLVRGGLLKALGGFDPRFFHQLEDADLCRRVWDAGATVRYCPDAEITHIGGQSRGTYPVKVILETERSKYKYFYKYYGANSIAWIRWISLFGFGSRFLGYGLAGLLRPNEARGKRLAMYRVLLKWNWGLKPVKFISTGEEPDVGYAPLARQGGKASASLLCR
jgi:GT2 family glycosyltransferase